MKKTFEVMRYEIVSALKRPSFLFFAFGVPLLAVLAFAGYTFVTNNRSSNGSSDQIQEDEKLDVEGYIDSSGLIRQIPEDIPPDVLVPFSSETEAQLALDAGDINAYYIIPDDYLESGEFYYIHATVNPISEGGQDWVMHWTLYVNLLDGNMEMASNIWNPANFDRRDLSIIDSGNGGTAGDCTYPGYGCESSPILQLLPMGVMAIIYISIISGGSYLLRLISSEKDSRIMELLLLSTSPRQLLDGKVLGYCLLGFLQVLAWLGAVILIFNIGGTSLNLPPGFVFPVSLLVWGLVFFLLGYAVYASLMAGAGALTPKLSQYTSVYFIVSIPLFLSYLLSIILIRKPHSLLSVALSIFPLSSPVMMITRLTVGGVPIWQPLIAAGLALIMAILTMRAVARMFRAQNLLSGQPFSASRYLRILFRPQ
jgi:ABC-2 type transport system permease protein